ncbi:SMP-30/gluconolactonase/LRE family protein [Thermodesulfobacteriota bacterium]
MNKSTFTDKQGKRSRVPLPPELLNLPTIEAEPWLQVDPDPAVILEGPAFDRSGHLYITSVLGGTIFKVTSGRKISTIFHNKVVMPTGCAFHQDRRLFVVCISGELISMNPDGSNVTYIKTRYLGKPKSLNDLVFDSNGNLYVTDFTGIASNPTGGVYRFSDDFTTVQPILENLAAANGISMSPEGNVLWVGETGRNAVIRIELLEDGITLHPFTGACYAYYSTGAPGGPDSNKVDAEGNLYQCIIYHGRAVVLGPYGIPIANVIIPGRDDGKHLITPNLAFKPHTSEAYILASGEGGAWIYKFKGLAKGLTLFSHQGA